MRIPKFQRNVKPHSSRQKLPNAPAMYRVTAASAFVYDGVKRNAGTVLDQWHLEVGPHYEAITLYHSVAQMKILQRSGQGLVRMGSECNCFRIVLGSCPVRQGPGWCLQVPDSTLHFKQFPKSLTRQHLPFSFDRVLRNLSTELSL
jgi:hypothetical protein